MMPIDEILNRILPRPRPRYFRYDVERFYDEISEHLPGFEYLEMTEEEFAEYFPQLRRRWL